MLLKCPISCWYFSYVPKNNSSIVKITSIVILTTKTQVHGKTMIECLDYILDHWNTYSWPQLHWKRTQSGWLTARAPLLLMYLTIGKHILDHKHCFDGKEHNPDDCLLTRPSPHILDHDHSTGKEHNPDDWLLRRPSPTSSCNQQRNWYWRLRLRPCR